VPFESKVRVDVLLADAADCGSTNPRAGKPLIRLANLAEM
jgi:hypothetical protein